MAEQKQGKVNPIQVQKFLGGIDYPCTKQDLVKTAKSKGADDRVMKLLEKLPEQEYNRPTDVTKELGKLQ